jgi:hypothetical protein
MQITLIIRFRINKKKDWKTIARIYNVYVDDSDNNVDRAENRYAIEDDEDPDFEDIVYEPALEGELEHMYHWEESENGESRLVENIADIQPRQAYKLQVCGS